MAAVEKLPFRFEKCCFIIPGSSICVFSRQSVRARVLLRHLQPPVAEPAPGLLLQPAVDSDEPRRCGPHPCVPPRD